MRNPLNSIYSLNLKMRDIVMGLLAMRSSSTDISASAFKRIVFGKLDELQNCLVIVESSTKLLIFCVNDMLALAQINQTKFRKDVSTFCMKDSVNEVV
jgi:signal transduction histidine kinase